MPLPAVDPSKYEFLLEEYPNKQPKGQAQFILKRPVEFSKDDIHLDINYEADKPYGMHSFTSRGVYANENTSYFDCCIPWDAVVFVSRKPAPWKD